MPHFQNQHDAPASVQAAVVMTGEQFEALVATKAVELSPAQFDKLVELLTPGWTLAKLYLEQANPPAPAPVAPVPEPYPAAPLPVVTTDEPMDGERVAHSPYDPPLAPDEPSPEHVEPTPYTAFAPDPPKK